jgi:hypothetical protein
VFLLVDNNLCSDTVIQTINVLWDCTVLPLTAAFNGTDTVYMDLSGVASFTNQSSNASNYLWNFGDGSTPTGVENPNHVYTFPGTYTVTLTAINYNCTTSVTGTVVVIEEHDASVSEQEPFGQVVLFPNPTNDAVIFSFSEPLMTFTPILITDINGKILHRTEWMPGITQSEIELSHEPAGMYFVTLFTQHSSRTFRVIKN